MNKKLLIERLSDKERAKLPDSAFAIIRMDGDKKERAWPIQDAEQALIALDFIERGFGDKKEYPEILKQIKKKYKNNSEVMKELSKLEHDDSIEGLELEFLLEGVSARVVDLNDLTEEDLEEGLLGSILGGVTGLAAGKKVGKLLARVLGVEKGLLYNLLTSRMVAVAIGAEIGRMIGKSKDED